MKPRALCSVALLVLALTLSAAPATAIILCEDCSPGDPPWFRCMGFCNGQPVQYCTDWLAMGCPTWLAPDEPRTAEEAEEAFIRSLRPEPIAGPPVE